jgi:hypothetical protein
MPQRKCIVLYNPISNEGHLDSWHVLFIEAFLHAGWLVIAWTADLKGLQNKLEKKGLLGHEALTLYGTDAQAVQPEQTQQAFRLGLKKHTRLTVGFLRTKLGRVVRLIQALWQSPEQRAQRLLALKYIDPRSFCADINSILAQTNAHVSAIFNMYIDAYVPGSSAWQQFGFSAPIPWMSLCITPADIANSSGSQAQDIHPSLPYYAMSDYRGTCLLEDALLESYQARWPNKQFAYLPDVTETGLPVHPTELAKKIKKLAAGRKIVFMGGSIGKQKNIARWFELIRKADSTKWYFVQSGRINKNNLTTEDANALAVVQESPPNNLYLYTDYIADELAFNEIISVVDFIFAVYIEFYRSSNMLSKAAYFEKPILVANQCLMGDRVTKYGIGLAVPADDTQAIHQGLTALVELPNLSANFSVYRQDFNQDVLQKRLIFFVEGCLSQAAGATTTLRQSEKCS